MTKPLILWFEEITKENANIVGNKADNLGEMINAGFSVPDGFCITSYAHDYFIKKSGVANIIKNELRYLNTENSKELNQISYKIKKLLISSKIPFELENQIIKNYEELANGKNIFVAVRASAANEKIKNVSFAGQQVTYLNISQKEKLLKAIKNCFASLFEPRAIFYRIQNNFKHSEIKIAVLIQKMVQAEISGVMFTADPVVGDQNKIVIEAGYGLGEAIVSGSINPDHYEISKSENKIINKKIEDQNWQIIKNDIGQNIHQKLPDKIGKKQKLADCQILKLSDLGKEIEDYYNFPQNIEWAIEKNRIYIIQADPITGIKNLYKINPKIENLEDEDFSEQKPILDGFSASLGIVSGIVKKIEKISEISNIKKGDILVAETTSPEFVSAMQNAKAIVTDTGGRTSHAALISRELGIPCVVGTGNATQILENGQRITVNGTTGKIYDGEIKADTYFNSRELIEKSKNFGTFPKTATKVYLNLGEPELAKEYAKLPVDGVGLLRAEFIIAGIGIHPKVLIKQKKQKEFINQLSQGILKIVSSFNPRPVIYRATDFKTNEYRNLKGGKEFEPEEANPMIGYRGAARYLDDTKVFELELKALQKIRDQGYKNLWLMIPYIRTVDEMKKVIKIIKDSKIHYGKNFKIWMMAEVPSTAILIEKFLELDIDGVSIGSNDLTQLILGIDRDNSKLAQEFDERNEAVVWCMKRIIKACKKYHKSVSICGQAVSIYPEIAELFVHFGATSVSVSSDAVFKTKKIIASVEKKLHLEKDLEI